MNWTELMESINAYDEHIAKEPLTHKDAIYELKESAIMYGRARDRVDMFESPRAYKIYADKVRSINATIKYLQNL